MARQGKWSKIKPEYQARPSPDMWNDRDDASIMNAAINSLDQVARDMEQRWGYGTLERLASPDLAAKFEMARESLRVACAGDAAAERR